MHILWAKMEALVEKGLTKSIGVSNFNLQLLSDLLTYAKIKPTVNQIQIYPQCAQPELVKWLFDNQIMPVAYSPCGRPIRFGDDCVKHPLMLEIADKYACSVMQVMIAWGLKRGYSVIPKAQSSNHQIDNLKAAEIQIEESDVNKIIEVLDTNRLLFKNAGFGDLNVFC